jgi:hypothetical protein
LGRLSAVWSLIAFSLRYTLIISARVPYMRFPAGDMPRLRLRSSMEGTALPSSATHHIAQQPHQAEPARTFKWLRVPRKAEAKAGEILSGGTKWACASATVGWVEPHGARPRGTVEWLRECARKAGLPRRFLIWLAPHGEHVGKSRFRAQVVPRASLRAAAEDGLDSPRCQPKSRASGVAE